MHANGSLPVWQERTSASNGQKAVGRRIFVVLTGLAMFALSIVSGLGANYAEKGFVDCVCTRNLQNSDW